MTEPYPREIRQLAGDDVADGVAAPAAPVDPEATSRDGGAGTGLVVASPAPPGDQLRADMAAQHSSDDAEQGNRTPTVDGEQR